MLGMVCGQFWLKQRPDLGANLNRSEGHLGADLESAFIVNPAETWRCLKQTDTVQAVFRKINLADVWRQTKRKSFKNLSPCQSLIQ